MRACSDRRASSPRRPASPEAAAQLKQQAAIWLGGGMAALVGLAVVIATGVLPLTPEQITGAYGYVLLAVTVAFFGWLFFSGNWTAEERKRLYLIGVFFVAAALFWSVFEQAGSTLNLFALRQHRERHADLRRVSRAAGGSRVNAVLIVLLAPVFAWLWVKLGDEQPASPTKFALGLIGVGLGFLVLIPAAQTAAVDGTKVGVIWLFTVYLIHTLAELCLSPVGLSSMTKLAPTRIVSLMMGVWFLGASVGNFLGGQAASFYEQMPLAQLLGAVAVLPMLAGVGMLVFRKSLTQLMARRDDGTRRLPAQAQLHRSRPSRRATRTRRGARARASRASSASRSTSRATCTTTSASSTTACSSRGPCPRVRRSTRRSSGSPCTSRITRFEYGTFEGVIPEGYGAGLVMLWDQGTWEPVDDDVNRALAKGDLKFTLDGYKLKGSWVLVRTRGYSRRDRGSDGRSDYRSDGKNDGKSWLLIKHRDDWSGDLDIAEFAPKSVKSGLDFPEILAEDNPDVWHSRPAPGGATGAMLRDIVEQAAALKHERRSAPKPEPRGARTRKAGTTPTRKKRKKRS